MELVDSRFRPHSPNQVSETCLRIFSDCVCEYLRVSAFPVLRERGDIGLLLLPKPSKAHCLDGS